MIRLSNYTYLLLLHRQLETKTNKIMCIQYTHICLRKKKLKLAAAARRKRNPTHSNVIILLFTFIHLFMNKMLLLMIFIIFIVRIYNVPLSLNVIRRFVVFDWLNGIAKRSMVFTHINFSPFSFLFLSLLTFFSILSIQSKSFQNRYT